MTTSMTHDEKYTPDHMPEWATQWHEDIAPDSGHADTGWPVRPIGADGLTVEDCGDGPFIILPDYLKAPEISGSDAVEKARALAAALIEAADVLEYAAADSLAPQGGPEHLRSVLSRIEASRTYTADGLLWARDDAREEALLAMVPLGTCPTWCTAAEDGGQGWHGWSVPARGEWFARCHEGVGKELWEYLVPDGSSHFRAMR